MRKQHQQALSRDLLPQEPSAMADAYHKPELEDTPRRIHEMGSHEVDGAHEADSTPVRNRKTDIAFPVELEGG